MHHLTTLTSEVGITITQNLIIREICNLEKLRGEWIFKGSHSHWGKAGPSPQSASKKND